MTIALTQPLVLRLPLLLLLLTLLPGCGERTPSRLEAIRDGDALRVGTLMFSGSFWRDAGYQGGFEWLATRAFAGYLGTHAEFVVYGTREALLAAVAAGAVDVGAASLTVGGNDNKWIRFSRIYRREPLLAVYRRGSHRPANAGALLKRAVRRSFGAHLGPVSSHIPPQPASEALAAVENGAAQVALVFRHELLAVQLAYPQLRTAFATGGEGAMAWAFATNRDDALYLASLRWIDQAARTGALALFHEQAYGHHRGFDYADHLIWQRHVRTRLPRFEQAFKAAGQTVDLDWRLLAALSYQESHWRPQAVSPTGVRGLMMLTRSTAKLVGVDNRSDPLQSILGGAKYLRHLTDRVAPGIDAADRPWFALASYNVGPGHLSDARYLTEALGGDSRRWADVRAHLPLLEDPRWHSKTRHGFARGKEPVAYVANIRRYYEALRLTSK
ncbi:MAG: membrane-bound lytic murein transglycosylase MltF [Gammaproteobacteria bacterium]|nr:membrane-bound lytic murein transglycosylase MltF [Gammaproteobacteria bacterium]